MKHKKTKGAFGHHNRMQRPLIAEDVKRDIAKIVRSVKLVLDVPGGICTFRSATGWFVLKYLGITVNRALGGMAYQAGPDPVRDVVGFCGPRWAGCMKDGRLLGHYWLMSGNDLVDFSVGDWRALADETAAHYYVPGTPELNPIQWTAPELPPFFWQEKAPLMRRGPTLKVGQAFYTGFEGNPPNGDGSASEEDAQIMKLLAPGLIQQCRDYRLKERLAK
jgi:hypothetical protein